MLSAACNDVATSGDDATANDDEPARKKSKKKKGGSEGPKDNTNQMTPSSKSSLLTRKRQLNGRLIVADVLLSVGAPVRPGKRILLHYTGSFCLTGKVFDRNNSKQHPLVFCQGTGEVIKGKKKRAGPVHSTQNSKHRHSD
jgi:FKBP-type peptidyl-prolyl cis-trans isomerase